MTTCALFILPLNDFRFYVLNATFLADLGNGIIRDCAIPSGFQGFC